MVLPQNEGRDAMSVGPMGIAGAVAASPQAQRGGSETERASQDRANQVRSAKSGEKAEKAAGIGSMEEDQAASDRDADGRKIWEQGAEGASTEEQSTETIEGNAPQSKDPTGQTGTKLDLSG
jgi:hypothetical protein